MSNKYKITGIIDVYNDKLEIIPEKGQDISDILETYYDNFEVSNENVNIQVTIIGSVLTIYNHPGGNIVINMKLHFSLI